MTQISNLNALTRRNSDPLTYRRCACTPGRHSCSEFYRRLHNDTQTEFANDLQNVLHHHPAAAEQSFWTRAKANPEKWETGFSEKIMLL